jgi:[protein-PII] uridylyltransferase
MRHQGDEIAWHTRMLSRPLSQLAAGATHPTLVRARPSPEGEGLQVLVYTADQPDLFARICGYFDGAGFSILDAKVHTTRDGHALDTFQLISPDLSEHYRELIAMVEVELARTLELRGPLPTPSRGRQSRRVKCFPVLPRVTLHPDEKAQRWVLTISSCDRVGLLYSIARVLARHEINLQLAKVTTLGERVEDTFLICGPALQHNREQIEIETELLEAVKD